jgi:hypothetical protein
LLFAAEQFGLEEGRNLAVPEFRAYILDINGHNIGVHELIADGHDEAVAAAIKLVDGHALELWQGVEIFGTLSPSNSGSGPTFFKRPSRR